ncbi:DUF4198 domain-containing protein [Polaribacter sp.]|uniref:DUF4198 domain-containing protein n=1 Tax=Polaribacter sp. TaxID=1920175 RepID=UPI003F6BAF7F
MNKNFKAKFLKPTYLFLAFILFCSHDLYIKMETYFLEPNKEATLSLYNGTFENSENIITRDRMLDASIFALGKRTAIDSANWKDKDSTITQLNFKTGDAGTYVVGVSTKARNIKLAAKKFNSYLKSDGVFDMLKMRTNEGLLNQDAVENYQKHVKAIYQVGTVKSNDWSTVLGYPIEFVPQANPYEKHIGETLEILLLHEGKPLTNQLIFADYIKSKDSHSHSNKVLEHEHNGEKHSHENSNTDKEHGHTHTNGQQLRTNAKGMVSIKLHEDGIYYLRTIFMTRATDSDELTHRSKWATLTFEVGHSHENHTHLEDHDHEDGVPMWVFILGSVLIVGVLFLVFRKKED